MTKIKIATQDEVKKLPELYKKAFKVHNIFTKPTKEIEKYLLELYPKGKFIVAVDGSKVIAGCHLVKGDKVWRIRHVAVHPDVQGKGLVGILLEYAEAQAKEGKVEMHVAGNDLHAVKIYESFGYRIKEELPDHYRKGEPCFVMDKQIDMTPKHVKLGKGKDLEIWKD